MDSIERALGFVRRSVRGMEGYVPGLQPLPGQKLVKLNTNENPFPPSPRVLSALQAACNPVVRLYPVPDAQPLRDRAAAAYGLSPSQVMCGNGSDEILSLLMRAFVDEGDTIAWFQPSYSLYPVLAGIARAKAISIPLPRVAEEREMADLPVPAARAKIFFLTTPNSPYGVGFPTAWIARLLSSFEGIVVADEAYVDFAAESSLPLLPDEPRLVIVRTLSKGYSLAGMRAGFAFAHEALIRELMKVKDSYNVGRLSQVAGCAALADEAYFRQTRDAIVSTRQRFRAALLRLGFTVPPSRANFLFAVPPAGHSARSLYEALLSQGFLVRHFSTTDLSDGLRISIGTSDEMENLVRTMEEAINAGQ